jgi:hypothetical protein
MLWRRNIGKFSGGHFYNAEKVLPVFFRSRPSNKAAFTLRINLAISHRR